VHLRRVEQRAERVLPAAVVLRGGVEDLVAPAVVEGDEQRDAVVGGGSPRRRAMKSGER
jgi:hypothetical protein